MSNKLANKYAVVAMGGVFPDAENIESFWQNIVNKHSSIKEVPDSLFDKETFYRPEVQGKTSKEDKSYTKLSAIIKDMAFNSLSFRIPPNVAKHMDDNQKLSLIATKQALDTGVLESVNNERVSVFMGGTMIGQLHHDFYKRLMFDLFSTKLNKNSTFGDLSEKIRDEIIDEVKNAAIADTFMITEDSAPGVLPNIIASRINSVFDFHGHAYMIDAACASSLASIICGIQQLELNEADAVICGGADMQASESGFVYFSGINALSPNGSFPFDDRADGFVIGTGGGVVVLKRLADAIKADDDILAVITGYGQLSDGKGKAIAAPNSKWQAEAIRRAYDMAGYSPESVELIEAHGTSTQVGDASEVDALKKCFEQFNITGKQFCGLSSVKSNIGHLKSAAGIAGFIKAVKAIETKTLPPVVDYQEENKNLNLKESPFYVIDEAKEWTEKDHPRRAGVSAFAFGGADYHIALEEFRKEDYENVDLDYSDAASAVDNTESDSLSDVLLLSGDSRNEILTSLQNFVKECDQNNALEEKLYSHNLISDSTADFRLAVTVTSVDDLKKKCSIIEECIEDDNRLAKLSLKGIFWGSKDRLSSDELALLFPGQGSQYADMTLDIKNNYASAETVFTKIDALWKKETGSAVTDLISSQSRGKEDTEKLLKDTTNTHPALLVSELALYSILKDMGIEAPVMVGHSAGEVIALAASGKLPLSNATKLMLARSKSFEAVTENKGAMAALKTDKKSATSLIKKVDDLVIANINSPSQTIVSGTEAAIDSLITLAKSEGVQSVKLNVSHAFHSPLMKKAEEKFKETLKDVNFSKSDISVYSNEKSEIYSDKSKKVVSQLESQITGSVNYVHTIETLYKKGTRLFIEVGPASTLTSLTKAILADKKDVRVISCDNKKGSTLDAFQKMICELFAAGIDFELQPQKRGKSVTKIVEKTVQVKVPADNSVAKQLLAQNAGSDSVVYSGVSVGLPGSFKNTFRDDNFDQLFEGRNQIEMLKDSEKEAIVDLHVSKLIKSEQGANYKVLDTLEDVIQLAGKAGQIDLLKEYTIDPKEIRNMSSSIALAVAAGYEALKDAYIPLVHEYATTKSGSFLPDRWALPQEMQKDTGIIFANGFPMIDPIIAEVSRHISMKFGNSLKSEIFDFYDSLIEKVSDKESRKLLSDWYSLHSSRLSLRPSEDEVYTFNHHLMNQLASQANNRLAHYINAQGPNFSINSACSSTATAITLSEEMIKSGRVKRMIVIGSDDVSTENSMPYVGAAFLSTGASSNEGDLYEAAVPFDKRRNGMIMGCGAVGIVVEAAESCKKRGINPVCELMGTHVFNTAGHHSALDVPKYAEELEIFINNMENEYPVTRDQIADKLIYMSHETYTPARGGCSESEAVSLKHVFGKRVGDIEVSNTKGMTGHTMGASIEDAVAARSLQVGKVPPVVNHKVADPKLADLKLSKGGSHSCEYALRMAAGFGSQGNYILLKKSPNGSVRILDKNKYDNWLSDVSNQNGAETELEGRRLLIKDIQPGAVRVNRPVIPCIHGEVKETTVAPAVKAKPVATPVISTPVQDENSRDTKNDVLSVIAEVTGYDMDMLDLDMEIEADLGVDTVKQATVLAMLGDKYGIGGEEGFRISDYPTIGHIVTLFSGNSSLPEIAASVEPVQAPVSAPVQNNSEVKEEVLSVISEVTGYEKDMLDLDMEIEADLGVDTVKQATVLAMLGDKYGIGGEEGFRISDYPTIGHIVTLFSGSTSESTTLAAPAAPAEIEKSITVQDNSQVKSDVLAVISEVTGYEEDMLDLDMEIEADLGVDTVKQATVLAMLGDKYGIGGEEGFRISDYPTIGHIVTLFSGSAEPVAVTETSTTALSVENEVAKDNFQVKSDVLSVISEVTGYEEDMLDLDMEIEADLGVDTVKQATVLAMLGDKYGIGGEEGFRISDYPTIGHIVTLFSSSTPSATPSSSPVTEITTVSKVAEREITDVESEEVIKSENLYRSIEEFVLSLFEKHTDYPADLVAPELGFNEDLGISTNQLFLIENDIQELIDDSSWKISSCSNLTELLKSLEELNAESKLYPVDFDAPLDISRQVLTMVEMPLDGENDSMKDSNILIIGESEVTADSILVSLSNNAQSVETFVISSDISADTIVEKFNDEYGDKTFDIIVDLTNRGETGNFLSTDIDELHQSVESAGDCRYALYSELLQSERIPGKILAIVSVDGQFGTLANESSEVNPITGLYVGFYKGLRKEWIENSSVKVLDIPESENLETIVKSELAGDFSHVEIGYRDGIRSVLLVEDQSFEQSLTEGKLSLDSSDTLIVAGGGSGITFRVTEEIAKNFSCNIALVGRTAIVPEVDRFISMSDEELKKEKNSIRDELKATGQRVTPVMIEREFQKITKSIEIVKNVKRLKSLGCDAQYWSVDVRDFEKLQMIIGEVKNRFGSISGIIHGAGVEISHAMKDKSLSEFNLVQSIKSLGACNLSVICKDEPLKIVTSFSSISGRFGNAAQIDYSAGNCFLNYWARMYNAQDGVSGKSLCWSGWAETGMAIKNTFVKDHAEYLGIHFINPDLGSAAAVKEICSGNVHSDIVLHNGLGAMQESGMSKNELASLPMVDSVSTENGLITSSRRLFSIKRDALLNHHRFGDTPLMPGVGFMEMMAETATLMSSGEGAYMFRDVSFSDAFKLYREEPRDVKIEITPSEDSNSWHMDVLSPFNSKLSKKAMWRKYSQADVSIEKADLQGMDPNEWDLGELTKSSYDQINSKTIGYKNNVHLGPILHDAERDGAHDTTLLWGEGGYRRTLRFPIAQFDEVDYPVDKYLINPAFLDTLHQAGAVYSILQKGEIYLPFGAGEFGVLKEMKSDEMYTVTVKKVAEEGEIIRYNIVLENEKNEITAFIRNSIFHRVNQ